MFLAVARPHGGTTSVSPIIVLPLGAGLAAAIAISLAAAHSGPRQGRPTATAFACGITFGVTAFLLKEMSQTLAQGFSPPSRQWALYTFIILEPVGFLLNQNAFQESALIGPVLSIRTVTNPGRDWHRPAVVIAVAHRAPQLTAQL